MDVRHNNNALQELNDCIRGLLHLGLNVITFRTLLHLGPNVITFRTLLHLGKLLHLGLQHPLQILHAVRHSGGIHNNAIFKGCSTLVAMVTTAACPRPGASFSNRNVAKKSEMFISLSQAKYNITNWHFYHT